MFTKRQQAELITSLQGRGEIPLKFAYLGAGATHWQRLSKKRSGGGINLQESNLLTKRMADFLKSFGHCSKINIFDLGCGDGSSIFPIIDELKNNDLTFRYIPIDISQSLLNLAEENIGKKYGCEIRPILFDFEWGNFSEITYEFKNGGYANFLCLLGSTVGNFGDKYRVLSNIRDSMGHDDFLLVGVEMINFSKIHKILQQYTGKLIEDFLFYIPTVIHIKTDTVEYRTTRNEKDHQIESRIVLHQDQHIVVGKETFVLEKDEHILLGRSTKFSEWSFTKLLSEIGFRTELLATTKDRSYVLSLLQPTRYTL